MEVFKEVFLQIIELIKEMWGALWKVLPTAFMFMLWVACAFFVLPAVFVANAWYPKWQEWGEGF